jgi:hypothetical protein
MTTEGQRLVNWATSFSTGALSLDSSSALFAIDPGFSVKRFSVTVDIEPTVFAPIAAAWREAGLPAR